MALCGFSDGNKHKYGAQISSSLCEKLSLTYPALEALKNAAVVEDPHPQEEFSLKITQPIYCEF